MVATAQTEEHFTIRHLIDHRGASLAISLFVGTTVGVPQITALYHGGEVDEAAFSTVQRVLKERLTRT